MKQFVFGLGNPGKEYATTRHNVGYQLVSALTRKLSGQEFDTIAKEQQKTKATFYKKGDIFLAESLTYMNESGEAVLGLIEYFDKELITQLKQGKPAGTAEQPRLIVIYDDLDIPLGQWKIQFGKGPKVHNGLNSIRQHLGSDQFLHVRIGVDGRQGSRLQSGKDYVLTSFYGDEATQIQSVLQTVSENLIKRLQ